MALVRRRTANIYVIHVIYVPTASLMYPQICMTAQKMALPEVLWSGCDVGRPSKNSLQKLSAEPASCSSPFICIHGTVQTSAKQDRNCSIRLIHAVVWDENGRLLTLHALQLAQLLSHPPYHSA